MLFHLRVQAALDALSPVRRVNVAYGHNLYAGYVDDPIDEISATSAQADATDPDRLARSRCGEERWGETGGSGQGGCRLACGA
jgi:hypothetical protein